MAAICYALSLAGESVPVRVFFDSGADTSFIRRDTAERLHLPIIGTGTFGCTGFAGKTDPPKQRPLVQCLLKPTQPTDSYAQLAHLWVSENLCAPLKPRRIPDHPELNHYFVADDCSPGIVDIMIGNDLYNDFVGGDTRLSSGLKLRETTLGWVLHGRGEFGPTVEANVAVHLSSVSVNRVQLQEQDAWELEGIGIQPQDEERDLAKPQPRWDEERKRIVVPMLWRSDDRPVPNFSIAKRRVDRMLSRLSPEKREKYSAFMQEKMDEGIIKESPGNWSELEKQFFLAHRAGERKFQVYFDASAPDGCGRSLNSYLLTGPNLLPKLLAVFLRFRLHNVGFQADVKSAFHQIIVPAEERPYLQFPFEDKVLHFCRAVFGVVCSPAMFHSAVEFLLDSCSIETEAVRACRDGLYFDDIVGGMSTLPRVKEGVAEAISLFNRGGMKLHKTRFSGEASETSENLLGMKWKTETDVLYHVLPDLTPPKTMREALSTTSKMWDPLGFLTPWTVTGKLIVQRCFTLNLKWDEPLPADVKTQLLKWTDELKSAPMMQVPRQCMSGPVELRCFVDASSLACCVCIYLVSSGGDSRLFVAKSRLAPSKNKLSIPRLELIAALMGARLYRFVREAIDRVGLNLTVSFFSDSQDVLYWLQRRRPTKVFVSNRVTEILKLTTVENWHYIPTEKNPADLGTRGISLHTLANSSIWWRGPSMTEKPIPFFVQEPPPSAVLEEKKSSDAEELITCPVAIDIAVPDAVPFFDHTRFMWPKALRITAYCFRFLDRLKRRTGTPRRVRRGDEKVTLTAEDLDGAKNFWIKDAQAEMLPVEEISDGRIPRRLIRLRPICEEGVVKCQLRTMEPAVILLPPNHSVTEAIVKHAHRVAFHQGVGATAAILSGEYHIARGEVKRIINTCQQCRRYRARPFNPPEAPLIGWRRELSRCFAVTGVDYFGPIYPFGGRKKCYVLLFTCFQSRAVHLELAMSQSIDDTGIALRRFLAIRGKPSLIVSDNAKTFIALSKFLGGSDGLRWTFIPERAPWWGSAWERLVGITKKCLLITVHNLRLTKEELMTVLYELTFFVNLRPLTTDTSGEVLTPAHFLFGVPTIRDVLLPAIPMRETNLAKAWNCQRQLLAHLKKRWQQYYLTSLRTWRRGLQSYRTPVVGEPVLIVENRLGRGKWHHGRIEELITGTDGVDRAAFVRTFDQEGNSILMRRSVCHLVPLEAVEPTPRLRGITAELLEDPDSSAIQPRHSKPGESAETYLGNVDAADTFSQAGTVNGPGDLATSSDVLGDESVVPDDGVPEHAAVADVQGDPTATDVAGTDVDISEDATSKPTATDVRGDATVIRNNAGNRVTRRGRLVVLPNRYLD